MAVNLGGATKRPIYTPVEAAEREREQRRNYKRNRYAVNPSEQVAHNRASRERKKAKAAGLTVEQYREWQATREQELAEARRWGIEYNSRKLAHRRSTLTAAQAAEVIGCARSHVVTMLRDGRLADLKPDTVAAFAATYDAKPRGLASASSSPAPADTENDSEVRSENANP